MAKGKKTGGGSRKNKPNKSTADARQAIALFVDSNSKRLQGWLDEIAADKGPLAAFECVMALVEYHVPKLARIENTGPLGGPIKQIIEVRFGGPDAEG